MAVPEQDLPRWSGPDGTQPPDADPVTSDPLAGLVTGETPVTDAEPPSTRPLRLHVAAPAGPDAEAVRQIEDALDGPTGAPPAARPPARHGPSRRPAPPHRKPPARRKQHPARLSPSAARRAARRGNRRPAGCAVLLALLVLIVVIVVLSRLVDVLGQLFH